MGYLHSTRWCRPARPDRKSGRRSRGIVEKELARYILTLGFDDEDQDRMSNLAERNQEGLLSGDEKVEFESFVKAGHMVALLHSKATMALKAEKAK